MDGFIDTPAGPVPRVHTRLSLRDIRQTISIRVGYYRYDYKVVPGLYSVGNPTPDSPVLVTCNYKLTFDMVRKELGGFDAWLLVADSRGINVWCAAGKDLFSTAEVVIAVNGSRLDQVVSHRELILPQLGATGVAAHAVRKQCGFKVTYGPVWARDLPEFLKTGNQADEAMRTVTFSLKERAELILVEITNLAKPLLFFLLAAFVVSGIGPDLFSFGRAWSRGLLTAWASVAGILAGTALVPLLLPHLPFRFFSLKGMITGGAAGALVLLFAGSTVSLGEGIALWLWTTTLGSYLGMNFTGSTPFTSPTGVETEMKRIIPIHLLACLTALVLWIAAPFTG